jgi:hypothetical protein
VTYTVSLADLTLLRMPGSWAIRARFAESLDTFRGPAIGRTDELRRVFQRLATSLDERCARAGYLGPS